MTENHNRFGYYLGVCRLGRSSSKKTQHWFTVGSTLCGPFDKDQCVCLLSCVVIASVLWSSLTTHQTQLESICAEQGLALHCGRNCGMDRVKAVTAHPEKR